MASNDNEITRSSIYEAFSRLVGDDEVDYGKFLELCVSHPPPGLGLVFKKGEADQLFREMDTDGNGVLDLHEFSILMRSVGQSASREYTDDELLDLFNRADIDGAGLDVDR